MLDRVSGLAISPPTTAARQYREFSRPHLDRQFTPARSDLEVEGLLQKKTFLLREGFLAVDLAYDE